LLQKDLIPYFISSYVPRKCGIATFTNNLLAAYQNLYGNIGKIIAVDEDPDTKFPPEVDFICAKNKISDYTKAADHINSSDAQVVNLQHEFGLFGGPEGQHIIKLLKRLRKPVVTTFHTVLQVPTLGYYTSFNEIIHHSHRVVVMSNKAKEILREVYYVAPEKIAMIPHGVPDLPFMDPCYFKKELGFEDRLVLLSFGLLSAGKGLELVLEALPGVVKEHPEILYVILGKTHPEVVKYQGEKYRESLKKLTRENHLENHVLFLDEFLTNEELYKYIHASDIYITPYHSQEQITSGTLAYAVALGKIVVSTPYWYAQEILSDGRGCLVPFNDPQTLAGTLNRLLADREQLSAIRRAAYDFGRSMIWPIVSERYHALFREVYQEHYLKKLKNINAFRIRSLDYPVRSKEIHLLERLTDDTGIFQHAKYGIPDLKYGYTADDVGRALGLVVRMAKFEDESSCYALAQKYLSFIRYVQRADGRFHNFVGYDRRYLDEVGGDDTFGRVLSGLGTTLAWSSSPPVSSLAKELFDRAIAGLIPAQPVSHHPKAMAYAICGLYHYLKPYPGAVQVKDLLRSGADHLVKLYRTNRETGWEWFEPVITYANAKIPYALMLAHEVFEETRYLDTAQETLNFLTNLQYNGTYFDLIGNKSWLVKGAKRPYFDQQPIEIGCLVEAYCKAFNLTQDQTYLDLANKAFNWFFGNNQLGVPVYNVTDDYPLDGLTAEGANENCGAESVIAFIRAIICLKEAVIQKTLERKVQVKLN
jgi:glycosyltransferase involved in cell wall biosynthesis